MLSSFIQCYHAINASLGYKGQLISEENFTSSILPKNELKNVIFALAYWGRNFSFVFWENSKNQKPFEITWSLVAAMMLSVPV